MIKTNTLKQQELRYRVTSESFADKESRLVTVIIVIAVVAIIPVFVKWCL